MTVKIAIGILALALLLAACAPAQPAEQPPADDVPTDDGSAYVACDDPRPEVCTKEYDPVCAQVDNGIRCITQPCPSEDRRTYGNACDACADPRVYGYALGACDPETDNNPVDDLDLNRVLVCRGGRDESFAAEFGFTCVEACPGRTDEFGSQVGLRCVERAYAETILSWPACATQADCRPEERCAQASHATSGGEIRWGDEVESFRCVPAGYAEFLLHTAGLTAIDENGERTTAIA